MVTKTQNIEPIISESLSYEELGLVEPSGGQSDYYASLAPMSEDPRDAYKDPTEYRKVNVAQGSDQELKETQPELNTPLVPGGEIKREVIRAAEEESTKMITADAEELASSSQLNESESVVVLEEVSVKNVGLLAMAQSEISFGIEDQSDMVDDDIFDIGEPEPELNTPFVPGGEITNEEIAPLEENSSASVMEENIRDEDLYGEQLPTNEDPRTSYAERPQPLMPQRPMQHPPSQDMNQQAGSLASGVASAVTGAAAGTGVGFLGALKHLMTSGREKIKQDNAAEHAIVDLSKVNKHLRRIDNAASDVEEAALAIGETKIGEYQRNYIANGEVPPAHLMRDLAKLDVESRVAIDKFKATMDEFEKTSLDAMKVGLASKIDGEDLKEMLSSRVDALSESIEGKVKGLTDEKGMPLIDHAKKIMKRISELADKFVERMKALFSPSND
jgi:hypothetical protein